MMNQHSLLPLSTVALLAVLAGCAQEGPTPAPTAPDVTTYRDYVQPIMDISCASIDCHGQIRHPLHLFSVDGLRMADGLRNTDPVDLQRISDAEVQANVDNIVAVDPWNIGTTSDIVLEKPLAMVAGGMFHTGGEIWKTTDDPSYACVRDWLAGATESDTTFTTECYMAITSVGGIPPSVDGGPVMPMSDAGPTSFDAGMSTGPAPTFTQVYTQVLSPYCRGCHGSRGSGGLSYPNQSGAYTNMVNVSSRYCSAPRVIPGDASNSGLYRTLVGSSCGSMMPPRSRLSATQIQLVGDWINAGAAND